MASIRIPKPFVEPFAAVRALDEAQAEAFAAALVHASPTMNVETLASDLPDDLFTEVEAADVVRAFVSLTAIRRINDWTVEETVERVAASDDLDVPEVDQGTFADRLAVALRSRSIALLGKATDMGTDHDKAFAGARVLTDIRPIFGDEISEGPQGVVLTHTLKVEYFHDEGQLGNVYVTLDEQDIGVLRSVLDRAERKAESMRQVLSEMNVSYLTPED